MALLSSLYTKTVTVVAAVDSCWLPWLFPGAQAGSVDLAHMTALHHACLASAGGCVDHLLAQPGTVLDSRDVSGCTALLYCLKNKNRNLEKATLSLPRVPSHLYGVPPCLPPYLPPCLPPCLPLILTTYLPPLQLLISHGASLTAALDSGFSELCYHTVQESS